VTETRKAILLTAAIALGAGVAIGSSLPWYGSIEECRLRESKGLPRSAMHLANSYCWEKFPSAYEAPAAEAPAAEEAAPAEYLGR